MSTDHTAFYGRQISLTEWLEGIGHRDSVAMREEDNDKRERLEVLRKTIGLPYDKPYQFPASDVAGRTPEFTKFLEEHGTELCAIRLIPLDPALPKLRVRGHAIAKAVEWFDEQELDPSKYRADFVPHCEKSLWASTFVVNPNGIFGEIIGSGHSDLTQGLYEGDGPVTFAYDYASWSLSRSNPSALEHLKMITDHLIVKDAKIREQLSSDLDAGFSHDYLQGYFETSAPAEGGLWFIDYNRILGRMYADFVGPGPTQGRALLSGQVGCAGVSTGRVRIVDEANRATTTLKPGEILVCQMTTPDYLPLMQQAAAIVTDLGGILSHAAIVARELHKPCLTATRDASIKLKDGMMITVDANKGVVTLST